MIMFETIELTNDEQKWFNLIKFSAMDNNVQKWDDPETYVWEDASKQLVGSLLGRDAIPKRRINYLRSKECNPRGHGKSIIDIFIKNSGKEELDYFADMNFIQFHLRYLISGPNVSSDIVSELTKAICHTNNTSGGIMELVGKIVRRHARKAGLNAHIAFKLGLELYHDYGENIYWCDDLTFGRSLYDNVIKAQNR